MNNDTEVALVQANAVSELKKSNKSITVKINGKELKKFDIKELTEPLRAYIDTHKVSEGMIRRLSDFLADWFQWCSVVLNTADGQFFEQKNVIYLLDNLRKTPEKKIRDAVKIVNWMSDNYSLDDFPPIKLLKDMIAAVNMQDKPNNIMEQSEENYSEENIDVSGLSKICDRYVGRSTSQIISSYSRKDVKEDAIKLGLDIKGLNSTKDFVLKVQEYLKNAKPYRHSNVLKCTNCGCLTNIASLNMNCPICGNKLEKTSRQEYLCLNETDFRVMFKNKIVITEKELNDDLQLCENIEFDLNQVCSYQLFNKGFIDCIQEDLNGRGIRASFNWISNNDVEIKTYICKVDNGHEDEYYMQDKTIVHLHRYQFENSSYSSEAVFRDALGNFIIATYDSEIIFNKDNHYSYEVSGLNIVKVITALAIKVLSNKFNVEEVEKRKEYFMKEYTKRDGTTDTKKVSVKRIYLDKLKTSYIDTPEDSIEKSYSEKRIVRAYWVDKFFRRGWKQKDKLFEVTGHKRGYNKEAYTEEELKNLAPEKIYFGSKENYK